jgi:hypothetical protein
MKHVSLEVKQSPCKSSGMNSRVLQKLVFVAGNLSQYWVLQVPTRWTKVAASLRLIGKLVRLMVESVCQRVAGSKGD